MFAELADTGADFPSEPQPAHGRRTTTRQGNKTGLNWLIRFPLRVLLNRGISFLRKRLWDRRDREKRSERLLAPAPSKTRRARSPAWKRWKPADPRSLPFRVVQFPPRPCRSRGLSAPCQRSWPCSSSRSGAFEIGPHESRHRETTRPEFDIAPQTRRAKSRSPLKLQS